jgi:PAS domain S-box-containing protein
MRILVVDDHQIVRRGVCSLLEAEEDLEVCGEAVDGRDAVDKATALKPHAIIMDISMPKLNGLEATREIRRILPETKILILSQHDIPAMMRQAEGAGAHGYVIKSAMSHELLAALKEIASGGLFFGGLFCETGLNFDVQEVLQRSIILERALRESDERLRLAHQIARIGTFEYNIKTGVNRWTPELESLYGLRAGEFPGTQAAWELLIHSDDRDSTVHAMKLADDEGGFEREWRVAWPDGSVHWLWGKAWLLRDNLGNPERWVGANIDITERKRAEERAQREARLLDLSFDAIVVRDANDRVRYWNRGAKELYGWTAEEASGQVTHTLLQTHFPKPLETIVATLRQEGRWDGELTHSSKDGKKVTVMSRWATFRDWECAEMWVLETNTDITKQKLAEESVRQPARLAQST